MQKRNLNETWPIGQKTKPMKHTGISKAYKKEEEGELKKGELCEFLSRVIRGRELGMSGKEKMSAVGLYMRLKGWDKVKEKEEEMVGEELVELLGGSKGVGEKNDTEES